MVADVEMFASTGGVHEVPESLFDTVVFRSMIRESINFCMAYYVEDVDDTRPVY